MQFDFALPSPIGEKFKISHSLSLMPARRRLERKPDVALKDVQASLEAVNPWMYRRRMLQVYSFLKCAW